MSDEEAFRPTDSERREYERRIQSGSGPNGSVRSSGSAGTSGSASEPVSPSLASAFGRPGGVDGAFAEPRPAPQPPRDSRPRAPQPVLSQAFGRPGGVAESFNPPPGDRVEPRVEEELPWWKPDAPRDPWRDPGSPAHLGAPPDLDGKRPEPAADDEDTLAPEIAAARRFRLRQVGIGSLTVVILAALLVGTAGGATGYVLGKKYGLDGLFDPDAKLTRITAAVTREPGSVAEVANRVRPAVVSIEVRGRQEGTGSGVVIDGDGYILTNNHVVAPADTDDGTIRVLFEKHASAEARIVGRDPKSDLAVIKVEKPGLTVASLGDSSKLAVGDPVIAIGSPLGLADTVTSGIVSALNRPVPLEGEGSDTNAVINAIQTDAAINPGNSGGALVDLTGSVVGINSAIATLGLQGSSGSIGVGFAIPVNEARDIAEQLIHNGEAKHATLGVSPKSVTELDGNRDGAQIQQVTRGSAADKAGLKEGDVIVGVNNEAIVGAEQLVVVIRSHKIGDKVRIKYVRGNSTRTAEVTLQSD